ncbi:protein LNK1 isoform X1 [Prunus dulcis]|uniref:protein LNK1 isoform X1 n=1 Tax=Prunus dulcis TaxID=3755 RepID=UPI0014821E1D|nr:protein LNK1 isoform X1 [Prunus dulcis]XP_034227107.1 protein LNK1 isoform X1 [Prunus dulcis]XP_034227108.1 protein LNK1 isoform X1 [Prunus dulcis]XP_034227109.1 protein LNK1 isoform X1 [Prunus dulcis]
MSDLCLYELEDNAWYEFGESDDHIVPHPGIEHDDQFPVEGDSRKKPRRDLIGIPSNANCATISELQRKEKTLTKKSTMLEKVSLSNTPDGAYASSCNGDSIKEVTSIASDDTGMSNHCLKSGNPDSSGSDAKDDIMGDGCTVVDNNLYDYPLNHISETDNDLSFLDNDREDRDSSDLLYYGWPDIGNFEDVDRMFRSCDSTFGLGSLNNEDELCWFLSSNSAEGSEDALKSGVKFSCSEATAKSLSENGEASKLENVDPLTNGLNKKGTSMGDNISSPGMDAGVRDTLGHLSVVKGSDAKSEIGDDLTLKEQINFDKMQPKHHKQPEGERIDRYVENGGSFPHYSDLNQFQNANHPYADSSCQVYSTPAIHQHKQKTVTESVRYMPTNIPYMHLDYSHPSDQTSVCPTVSGTQSDNNVQPSPSLKETSYASNQVLSMESSCGPFNAPSVVKKEKQLLSGDFEPPFSKCFNILAIENPETYCDPVSVQKKVQQSANETEGHSDVEGGASIGMQAEFDSSDLQESSCLSSVLDEISLEATSFRQLQQVTEQLDIRTKLCIRDSLYRLAKSAEQRHNCANKKSGNIDSREANVVLLPQETDKCIAFMDVETDTNPIDRSIAHLLFHRPKDPSARPANDPLSLRSSALIHGSVNSTPGMPEKQVFPEGTAASDREKDGDE